MLYTIKAFKNTGFSPLNVPDSKNLAETSGASVTFDSVWLLQDLSIQTVKVNAQWETVQDIDYVEVNNKFYFCTDVSMVNENCAALTLELDALTTIGINNISVNSGWCTRRHVNDDTLFKNVIEEDWGPSEPYEMDSSQIGPTSTEKNQYVCSTVLLDHTKTDKLADTYVDAASGGSVFVPRCPDSAVPTQIMLDFDDAPPSPTSLKKQLPWTTLFKLNWNDGETNTFVLEAIATLRSLGLDNAITGAYSIPKGYISRETNPQRGQTPGTGADLPNYLVYILASAPQNYPGPAFRWSYDGYNVRNNKVFAGQYNKFLLVSPVSGDREVLDAHDIYIDGTTNTNFTVFADLGPGGSPYCRPLQYRGVQPTNTNPWYEMCVKGGTWLNVPLAFSGASGSLITTTNANTSAMIAQGAITRSRDALYDERALGTAHEVMGAVGSVVGGTIKGALSGAAKGAVVGMLGGPTGAAAGAITGAALGIGGGVGQLINPENLIRLSNLRNDWDRREAGLGSDELNIRVNQFNTIASTSLVPPEIKFPVSDTIQSFTNNCFQCIRFRLSRNDTERFDRYLTMFGYRVSEPLTTAVFSGRQFFNYVEANSIDINVPSGTPLRVKMQAIDQLSRGVRIWHVKPANSYFSNNPIV